MAQFGKFTVNIIGRKYGEALKCEPKAKMDDPSTRKKEKTKTPTRKKQKKCTNLNRYAEIRTKAFCQKAKEKSQNTPVNLINLLSIL